MQCISPRNLDRVAISENYGVVPNCKFRSHDPNSASLGVTFSSSDKGLHAVYFPTKFGIRSFIRSKVMEWSRILNLGHVTMTTPTLWVILLCIG